MGTDLWQDGEGESPSQTAQDQQFNPIPEDPSSQVRAGGTFAPGVKGAKEASRANRRRQLTAYDCFSGQDKILTGNCVGRSSGTCR
jgi:hypothetical protein